MLTKKALTVEYTFFTSRGCCIDRGDQAEHQRTYKHHGNKLTGKFNYLSSLYIYNSQSAPVFREFIL